MSWLTRIVNVLRADRLNPEIDEELQSHLAEAIEQGRYPAEARRAFGSPLRLREESRDVRLIPWLDSLRADAIFGWRQILKKKVTSAAAILSLALALGACTSAFRLIDALLLRPLPVAHPERLYSVFHQSNGEDTYEYPLFRRMRAAVNGQAEVIAVSTVLPVDLTYGSDQDTEKAWLQFVSGWMFGSFGLRPAVGRLFTETDDLAPRAHPYAVLSHDYWTRRFDRDPKIIGRTFRMGKDLFEIVGVAPAPFTGTQTGTVTDVFVPTMMGPAVTTYAGWIHTLVRLKAGVAMEPIRDRLRAPFRAFHMETAKGFKGMPKQRIDEYLGEKLFLEPAAAGVSRMQRYYRQSLVALGVLVALVLLIACANVANLMTAQAAARTREMALRVSIGAGQWRLVQMVLVESAWLGCLASIIGGAFSWWAAPFVVARINPPQYPARLSLPADWRVLAFAVAATLAVTFLFGLPPALRARAVKPASVLKGGDDPHSRRRLMHMLIAVQVAFCFLVLFVGSLFVATSRRLSNEPTGFSTDRLLTLDTIAPADQPPAFWNQIAAHLRAIPGVEAVALASWPLLDGYNRVGGISVNGAPPGKERSHFMSVSPGWFAAMRIPLTEGRDFRAGDPEPGVAVVNHAFAKRYFNGENPLGKFFENTEERLRLQIVGLVGDARYLDIRGPWVPVAYVPLRPARQATLIVRMSKGTGQEAYPALRQEVPRARPGFRVSNIRTQAELLRAQTVRERLLALLALFFAGVALLLAGIGLYGVLDYGVLQRRCEIGIRMAIGAQAGDIARRVTADVFGMVLVGAVAGLAAGMASVRYIQSLLFQVKATDLGILALPSMAVLAAALLAAAPAVLRAVRIDPASMLRAD